MTHFAFSYDRRSLLSAKVIAMAAVERAFSSRRAARAESAPRIRSEVVGFDTIYGSAAMVYRVWARKGYDDVVVKVIGDRSAVVEVTDSGIAEYMPQNTEAFGRLLGMGVI